MPLHPNRWTRGPLRALFAGALLGSLLSGPLLAAPSATGPRADTRSVPVTAEDLLEREALWPYQVALARAWRPEGHAGDFGWGAGTLGVLLRVEDGNRLRIDFGRFGVQTVPIEATDVVARANQVRIGEIEKLGPNLAVALNHRLLDPRGKTLAPARDDLFVVPKRLFVLVFADPADPRFEAIARGTAEWGTHADAVLALLSSKEHVDAHVYKYAYDAGWKGDFLMDRYAAAYVEGYLDPDIEPPAIALLTPEGRVLFAARWSDGALSEMKAIAERERSVQDALAQRDLERVDERSDSAPSGSGR